MKLFALCKKGMPREEVEEVPPEPQHNLLTSGEPSATPAAAPAPAAPAKSPSLPRGVKKEANPPRWPASVHVVEPDGKFVGDKQALFDCIFTDDGKYSTHPWNMENANTDLYGGYFDETGRDFCAKRVAVLLKPGAHKAKFNVGFYNSLVGLGRQPGDVQLDAFECLNGVGPDHVEHSTSPGALDNFWRSVENLQTASGNNIYYFVSQASPLRKIHVQGQLRLCGPVGGGVWDWGWASGGYTADCKVDGGVEFGGQQQWITRNTEIGSGKVYAHGAWSNVIVGSTGPYKYETNQLARCTEVQSTERIAEKPYIVFEESQNRYFLRIPRVEVDKKGISWGGGCDCVDFEQVYVAEAGKTTAQIINAKFAEGKHVILSPGIYKLSEPIVIGRSNAVLMGLGLATVEPADSAPYMDSVVFVKDGLENVRVAGLMLQAGERGSDALLKWGSSGAPRGDAPRDAGFMHDIFCRVGGDRESTKVEVWTNKMVQVNTSNVVGDNLWLWRADHEVPDNRGVKDSRNKVYNALEVNGDNVIMYGLFCEHALQDLTVWNGENGKTFFYQCEMPYDVTQENFGDKRYAGYTIADHVKNHTLEGAGVYSFFRDHDVHAACGFKAPEGEPGIRLTNIFTVFLNGKGCIENVLNQRGRSCSAATAGRPCFL